MTLDTLVFGTISFLYDLLQSVAVGCSVLQRVAEVVGLITDTMTLDGTICYSVLHVLQCVAVCYIGGRSHHRSHDLRRAFRWYILLQVLLCVAVCRSVLQCVAVCCSAGRSHHRYHDSRCACLRHILLQ